MEESSPFFASTSSSVSMGRLRETLLMMASLTDRNFSFAMRALVDRNDAMAEAVEAEDSQLDELEVSVDEQVISHMATHSPVATDCRFMIVASKISSNLERMADQSVTIARRARELNREPLLKPLIDIPRMAGMAEAMARDSITALIERRTDLAQDVVKRDKQVDALNRELAGELIALMVQDTSSITRALNLILVAKCIERIADHAKNISEEVYYLYLAKDIRHSQ